MSDVNRTLARRWFEEVWNDRRAETIDELMSAAAVGHMEGGVVRGPGDFKAAWTALCFAFPDLRVTVEDVIAEGDRVVVRWSARGRHTGPGLGAPASDREASFRGMTWLEFADGKIVRGWDSWNLGRLMQELGAVSIHPSGTATERRG